MSGFSTCLVLLNIFISYKAKQNDHAHHVRDPSIIIMAHFLPAVGSPWYCQLLAKSACPCWLSPSAFDCAPWLGVIAYCTLPLPLWNQLPHQGKLTELFKFTEKLTVDATSGFSLQGNVPICSGLMVVLAGILCVKNWIVKLSDTSPKHRSLTLTMSGSWHKTPAGGRWQSNPGSGPSLRQKKKSANSSNESYRKKKMNPRPQHA